jgi:hypothetical protein
MIQILRWNFGPRLRIGPAHPDGRVEIEVGGWHPHMVAAQLAGFGRGVEVTGPPEVRAELAGIAAELVELYAPTGS